MVRFPACRFVWSSLADLPEVGPLLDIDKVPPGHASLFRRLEAAHGQALYSPDSYLYAGWLELRAGVYRIGAGTSDAQLEAASGLAIHAQHALLAALKRWAEREGFIFDPTLP